MFHVALVVELFVVVVVVVVEIARDVMNDFELGSRVRVVLLGEKIDTLMCTGGIARIPRAFVEMLTTIAVIIWRA